MKDKIKFYRLKLGMTQKELADELGYNSPSLITMWESGDRKPQSDVLPKLAKVLSCTINELYE